jgi:K319L-like, PKD domain/Right handed beta helix region
MSRDQKVRFRAGHWSTKALLFLVFNALLIFPRAGTTLMAAGYPPSVDAGSAKVIALPVKDVTLFGHATDPDSDAMTFLWTEVSGPDSSTFSAPWALATTVSFKQAGTYVFRLTASDGTSISSADTTVSVLNAASQTAFYVDPTYTAGSNDGSQAHPWTTLAVNASSAPWLALNNALASNNVIVFFSARTAGSDVSEIEHNEVNIWRTDTSTHRLTLDGMSLYNANDVIPSWLDQNGAARFHIDITSGSLSIGVQTSNSAFPMHYTTIRGFELSGASGRALIAGNATVFEYNHVHDVSVTGATVQFQPAVRDYPYCTVLFGNLQDITFRSNLVERGAGESFYIAGTYTRQADGGCLSWGNTHSDILLEGNTIRDSGPNAGEHDGIDLKAGLRNVTVRGNLITDRPSGTKGISALGVFYPAGTCCIGNYVIEDNVFLRNAGNAIVLQKQNGAVVRNNVSDGGGGMSTSGDTNTDYWLSQQVAFYNNTLYANATGISVLYANRVVVQNNLIFDNGTGKAIQGNSTATQVSEDYNIYTIGTAQVTNGGHSQLIASSTGLVADAVGGNLQLPSGSPAINAGINLAATGFSTDILLAQRQQGASWDVGAYTFKTTSGVPMPPVNVRVLQ